ncbi:acyltransferase [Microbacterium sp. SSW1-47]|uniref:acyltransferase family protein n=1 Tax=Microbacterium sufflavum TaxID=2851649 RepID=UPI001FFDDED6|nr:acyltransferase [Microbacterium sufflavum]MCK2026918.1 acyltransferase [Microbacterium sufflavum]
MHSASTLAQPTQRLDSLTGLRWWAAFAVFLYHMNVFAPLPGSVQSVLLNGYLGVTFFFVLSGFVLTWSARPNVPTSTFYWRRFARIWPSHMVALLIAIPVFYTLAPVPEGSFLKPFDLGILLLSVVVIQAWWSNPAILFSGNPAAWTLTCEAFFYALHPWISRVLVPMAKRGALLLAVGVVAYAFVYRAVALFAPDLGLAALPVPVQRLPEFVLGMALAWAIRSGWRPRIHPLIGVAAPVAVILAHYASGRFIPTWSVTPAISGMLNELFTVACGIAIVSLAVHALRGGRLWFASKWQVRLGEWSFAFYLVHATFIYVALRVFGYQPASWSNLLWFAALFVVDLVAAWALHTFVERTLEKRMRRWKDDRDARRRTREAVASA